MIGAGVVDFWGVDKQNTVSLSFRAIDGGRRDVDGKRLPSYLETGFCKGKTQFPCVIEHFLGAEPGHVIQI